MGYLFIEVDKLRNYVEKKCWLSVANDYCVGSVLDFVCGSRSIKSARWLFMQLKNLPTMCYGIDLLKTYEDLIP